MLIWALIRFGKCLMGPSFVKRQLFCSAVPYVLQGYSVSIIESNDRLQIFLEKGLLFMWILTHHAIFVLLFVLWSDGYIVCASFCIFLQFRLQGVVAFLFKRPWRVKMSFYPGICSFVRTKVCSGLQRLSHRVASYHESMYRWVVICYCLYFISNNQCFFVGKAVLYPSSTRPESGYASEQWH